MSTPKPGADRWSVAPAPLDRPDASAVLREYMTELASRYYGRPATTAEVDTGLADEPLGESAVLLLARDEQGVVAGCVGLRRLGPGSGEVTKVFVRPQARGRGGGVQLLAAVERTALELGLTTLRLDTRADLVEARALYARCGYREIPRYNDSQYADHWFQKDLTREDPTREDPTTPPAAS